MNALVATAKSAPALAPSLHGTPDGNSVSYFGPLKVNGNRITDEDGKAVQLRGMSFFRSLWMGKYYNNDCAEWLKDDWYCNIVRAAMAIEEGSYRYNQIR